VHITSPALSALQYSQEEGTEVRESKILTKVQRCQVSSAFKCEHVLRTERALGSRHRVFKERHCLIVFLLCSEAVAQFLHRLQRRLVVRAKLSPVLLHALLENRLRFGKLPLVVERRAHEHTNGPHHDTVGHSHLGETRQALSADNLGLSKPDVVCNDVGAAASVSASITSAQNRQERD
jgi:hypothetical protein